jgi:hypothetical protein
MLKLPFDYVDREVDKLYQKEFDSSEVDAINKHCEFIADFIRACGWTEDEYIRAMFRFEPLDESNHKLN